MYQKKISMIVACDDKGGIGKGNELPWKSSRDMKYFKNLTLGTPETTILQGKKNAVIMGRKTWESIPEKFRPLPGRINVILSRVSRPADPTVYDTLYFSSLEKSLEELSARKDIGEIFIIGGSQIYNYALENNLIDTIYITRVSGDYECDSNINLELIDTNFERILQGEELEEEGYKFKFNLLSRKKSGV